MKQRAILGYAVGDFGINLYFISVLTYLLYFYTDVFGISALSAAGVFAVARFVDAVTDPIMGAIAERTRSRWGRMRPYILFGAIPLGLISVLTYTVPDLDTGGKVVWAYTTYILFGLIYTLVTIPYATLTASLTTDYEERTKISSYRIGFAFAGGMLVSVGTFPFVGLFETQADGFFYLMLMFSVISSVLLFITYKSTAEVVPPSQASLSLSASLKSVFQNPPLIVVIGIFCCGMLSFTVRQTVTPFYFIHNVGDPGLIPWYFGITLGCMLLVIWAVPLLATRMGKEGAISAGAVLAIVASIGFYLTPYDATAWIFFWGCAVAIGSTPVAVLGWAMIPDTVEYAQWKHGVRADGAIFSTASFFQKLAKTIGGAGAAFVLGLAGYIAHQEQTPAAKDAILYLLTLAPIAILIVLIILTRMYKLDAATHDQIVRELDTRAPLRDPSLSA